MRSGSVRRRAAAIAAVLALGGCGFFHRDARPTAERARDAGAGKPRATAPPSDAGWTVGLPPDPNGGPPSGATDVPSPGGEAGRPGYAAGGDDAWTIKTDGAFSGVVFDVFINNTQIGEYASPNVSADITAFLRRGRNKVRVRWMTPPGSGGAGTLVMGGRHAGHWTTLASITGGRFQVAKGDAVYQVLVP